MNTVDKETLRLCYNGSPFVLDVSEPPSQPKPKTRPTSAKTPSTQPTSRAVRAASAGTMSRGPFVRPHPPSHPPTGRATMQPKTQLPTKIPKAKPVQTTTTSLHSHKPHQNNNHSEMIQPNGKGETLV